MGAQSKLGPLIAHPPNSSRSTYHKKQYCLKLLNEMCRHNIQKAVLSCAKVGCEVLRTDNAENNNGRCLRMAQAEAEQSDVVPLLTSVK